MNRRDFLTLSATGIIGLGASSFPLPLFAKGSGGKSYSMIILGDTHFDADPPSIYHAHYNEPNERLNKIQRGEFARNGEMWKDRCPRLLRRAAGLIDKDTRMVLQMGDLIQGDCGDGEVHKKMLSDVMNRFKQELGGLPFVTVVGNHDIRGPDDAETDRLLDETKGARHTFVMTHGPVLPPDISSCRWFYHGGASEANTQARLHFRQAFAKRNAIVLCGHTHYTDFKDWWGDGGRITQMTMSSVWTAEEQKQYVVRSEGAANYGMLRKKMMEKPNGANLQDESALFDEYRPGLRQHLNSRSQGSYKLNVSKNHVSIDFYGGDSEEVSHRFIIR